LVTGSLPVDAAHVVRVQQRLLEWYAQHGRDLPWRHTRDPYAILVAEVMLQQTQVDRVIPKWRAWLEQFPTLCALGSASRADAIRAWQGLGYNLRAVRLHAIAQHTLAEFGGRLPSALAELQRLHGIGHYTAGAIACFAFGQRVPVVETNIRRVLSRVFLAHGNVQRLADSVLPVQAEAAYAWNQALMDVGASLCRPREPLCLVCPLLPDCRSQRTPGLAHEPRHRSPVRFESTERYVRGRILDALRPLEPGESLAYEELVGMVPSRTAAHLLHSSRRLAAEGLVSIDDAGRLRLPT
jgi:A/G-specific adenine glycosylase